VRDGGEYPQRDDVLVQLVSGERVGVFDGVGAVGAPAALAVVGDAERIDEVLCVLREAGAGARRGVDAVVGGAEQLEEVAPLLVAEQARIVLRDKRRFPC